MEKYWQRWLLHLKVLAHTKPRLVTIMVLVFGLHLFFAIYSTIHPPARPDLFPKKLIVKTMTLPPDQSKPTAVVTREKKEAIVKTMAPPVEAVKVKKTTAIATKKKIPTETSSNKKTPDKTAPLPSKTKKLLADLQESIAKIEINRDNSLPAKTIVVPKPISQLKADTYEIQYDPIDEEGLVYRDILIQYLKDSLHLPGYGVVKIKLTLEHVGHAQDVTVVSSDSEVNRVYLERMLQELVFPPFIGELANKNLYTFCLTFCSDQ